MKLNYPMRPNGMYVLRRQDFDDIATMVLSEYMPRVLREPQALDIDYLVSEPFCMNEYSTLINLEGNILGAMVFSNIVFTSFDDSRRPVETILAERTMVIDKRLSEQKQIPRLRFTKAHELSHWICHRSYHMNNNFPYEFRTKRYFISCQDKSGDKFGYKDFASRTDEDWEEWQADWLAAALLMPRAPFINVSHAYISHAGIRTGYISKHTEARVAIKIISNVAEFFAVSYTAARIRMTNLGLIAN